MFYDLVRSSFLLSREMILFESLLISLLCCLISLLCCLISFSMPAINLANLCRHYVQTCAGMWLCTVQVCQYPRVTTDFECVVKTMGPCLRYRHAKCARLRDSAVTSQINTARLTHKFCTFCMHFKRKPHLVKSETCRHSKYR